MSRFYFYILAASAVSLAPISNAWSNLSVWEQSKDAAYGMEGHIKSIGINEDENAVLVKFQTVGSDHTETYRVCLQEMGHDVREFQKSQMLQQMRSAFANERPIRATLNGRFDQCLLRIAPVGASAQL